MPETALATPVRELDGCYLRVRCPAAAQCSKVSEVTIKNLVRQHNGMATLTELLPRLRCNICRSRAGHVELCGPRVAAPGSYAPPSSAWQVVLIGP